MQSSLPNFCWDRNLNADQIHAQLRESSGFEWVRIASWIIREASFSDIWTYLTPAIIRDNMDELAPYLGRRRELVKYILGEWHELGKI